MANAIRRECGKEGGWKERLAEFSRRKVERECRAAAEDNNEVDELVFTQFGDKVSIISISPRFDGDGVAFEAQMKQVRKLRNNLAHANEYAATRKSAAQICATVRAIEQWIERLDRWPSTQAPGGG